ncbi:hypothetical protein P2318_00730 [Myxococcaceae bacterium GXIMD 01537]
MSFYEEHGDISVAARTDRDFVLIYPSRRSDTPYTGKITWVTSSTQPAKGSWRDTHSAQVAELMRLVDSPLAQAAGDSDFERKTRRLVPCADGFGQEELPTVRGYGEGLAGLFWRNFYGPPFLHLFGERLASLPPEARTDLGADLVLVQPYALPTEAGTPEAEARERALISHLGPECFYDFEHHRKPTRRPVLVHS